MKHALRLQERAEYRLEQLRQPRAKTVGLAEGALDTLGKVGRSRGMRDTPREKALPPTLAEAGIDKLLVSALGDRLPGPQTAYSHNRLKLDEEDSMLAPRVERLAKVWGFRIRRKRNGRFDLMARARRGYAEYLSSTHDTLAEVEAELDAMSGCVTFTPCGSVVCGRGPILREEGNRLRLEQLPELTDADRAR